MDGIWISKDVAESDRDILVGSFLNPLQLQMIFLIMMMMDTLTNLRLIARASILTAVFYHLKQILMMLQNIQKFMERRYQDGREMKMEIGILKKMMLELTALVPNLLIIRERIMAKEMGFLHKPGTMI